MSSEIHRPDMPSSSNETMIPQQMSHSKGLFWLGKYPQTTLLTRRIRNYPMTKLPEANWKSSQAASLHQLSGIIWLHLKGYACPKIQALAQSVSLTSHEIGYQEMPGVDNGFHHRARYTGVSWRSGSNDIERAQRSYRICVWCRVARCCKTSLRFVEEKWSIFWGSSPSVQPWPSRKDYLVISSHIGGYLI